MKSKGGQYKPQGISELDKQFPKLTQMNPMQGPVKGKKKH